MPRRSSKPLTREDVPPEHVTSLDRLLSAIGSYNKRVSKGSQSMIREGEVRNVLGRVRDSRHADDFMGPILEQTRIAIEQGHNPMLLLRAFSRMPSEMARMRTGTFAKYAKSVRENYAKTLSLAKSRRISLWDFEAILGDALEDSRGTTGFFPVFLDNARQDLKKGRNPGNSAYLLAQMARHFKPGSFERLVPIARKTIAETPRDVKLEAANLLAAGMEAGTIKPKNFEGFARSMGRIFSPVAGDYERYYFIRPELERLMKKKKLTPGNIVHIARGLRRITDFNQDHKPFVKLLTEKPAVPDGHVRKFVDSIIRSAETEADAEFDALVNNRPYRPGSNYLWWIKELQEHKLDFEKKGKKRGRR